MKKIELLAPAGNMECLIAAINAGCDAVYIGGKQFGARAFSNNFSNDEIIKAINYCHLYGVKIYATVNTIIYENEVDNFISYIRFLHKNNIDAVIMQDLGMIDLVRKKFPNLDIHASTQCHIHNLDGTLLMEKLGLKRVVLARETSVEELKKIKENSNIELEVFVHGALCMSYSGQCLMSSLIGGRSGNRGTCSQCCRLEYDLISDGNKVNKNKYLLSTKDLCTINDIGKLIDMGITSLKIEGRMKRKEYVYLVVSLYRKAIDSYYKNKVINISKEDIDELKKIFNRQFTRGYLFNDNIINSYRPNHLGIEIGKIVKINKNKIYIQLFQSVIKNDGIRILSKKDTGLTLINFYKDNKLIDKAYKEDIISINCTDKVSVNDKVVKTTDYLQLQNINSKINELKKININMKVEIKDKLKVSITDNINKVEKTYDLVEVSKNCPIDENIVKKQLSKLGNTIYNLNKIETYIEPNRYVNIKSLNEVRRDLVNELNSKRLYKINFLECEYQIALPNFKKEKNINYQIYNKQQYNMYKNKAHNLYSDELINDTIYITPRVIDNYCYNDVMISEIGGINCVKSFYTDVYFNVVNSYTVAFLHSLGSKLVTLSYELNYSQVNNIIDNYKKRYNKNPNCEVIIFGYPQSMIIKYDILNDYNIKSGYLKDRYNNKFKIVKKNNYTIIYNYKKIELNDNYLDIVNNIRYNLNA